ncbi:MAG: DUF5131 family protein, partial [Acetatifactor sp.]|nr:DUF5131 family protein [Acetatifactor sp.]
IHNYLFLTKNPERYESIDAAGMLPTGKNLWYGSTLTTPEDKCFISNAHNTFWSIEPIHAPFRIWDKDEFSPDWIIIGAETGRSKDKVVPEFEWIKEIVRNADSAGIPVFMKDSLIPIVGEKNMRRDFPEQLQHSEISPKMKKKLFDICAECKTRLKKSDMITLLARSRRGEQPKQFGFMCKDCFRQFCKRLGLDLPDLAEMAESITIDPGDDDG